MQQGKTKDMVALRRAATIALVTVFALTGCGGEQAAEPTANMESATPAASESTTRETPRYEDGVVRFDRIPGEQGYWGDPSKYSLIETGVDVNMNEQGLLANISDAPKVAPFMDWSLGLYQYRQQNGLKDDPAQVCIAPAGPRHLHAPGGFRIIQDRNYDRVYLMFGGGNRNWRVINMDGRVPPNPDEVTGTYYGYSTGHWEGDTLVVESSGFNDRFWFSNGGLPHTSALHLTERFTRNSYDTLTYQVIIDDKNTYTRPWNAEWTLAWVNGEIEETFCEQ